MFKGRGTANPVKPTQATCFALALPETFCATYCKHLKESYSMSVQGIAFM